MKSRTILWTVAMAYAGFLLAGQGPQTFNNPHEAWVVDPCAAPEPIRLAVEIINQLWH